MSDHTAVGLGRFEKRTAEAAVGGRLPLLFPGNTFPSDRDTGVDLVSVRKLSVRRQLQFTDKQT